MLLLGLTGGVGMGKSTVAEMFSRGGVRVVDTDALAREVVAPGSPGLARVVEAFGTECLTPAGTLNREWMAGLVFEDPGARRRLEGILHPLIRAAWQERVAQWRRAGCDLAMVVIPLLYETEADGEVDRVICVACRPDTQRERLRQRGWSDEEIARRNAAQLPAEEKMRRADVVIWTEGTLKTTAAQVERVLQRLRRPTATSA
ncbi:MAG: dephospho-CoA kinase [Verrucomicrobia bacterium]|nr:MAG: dephospho-CoA kinase [Verrucomicrobiota bacterium]